MIAFGLKHLAASATAVVIAGSGALVAAAPAGAAPAAHAHAHAAKAKHAATRAAEPRGKVVSRTGLLIRSAPTTASKSLGSFPSGAVITLNCKKVGQNVNGNKLWYLLGAGKPGYVAARYVQNLSPVPYCK